MSCRTHVGRAIASWCPRSHASAAGRGFGTRKFNSSVFRTPSGLKRRPVPTGLNLAAAAAAVTWLADSLQDRQDPQCSAWVRKAQVALHLAEADPLEDHSGTLKLIEHAHDIRKSVAPAHQSHFRVVAIICYEDNQGQQKYVTGVNAEPCYIGGSICAERAALCRLREVPDCKRVLKVIIVSDSPKPLSPGVLCREFLSTHLEPYAAVVMSGSDPRAKGKYSVCRVEQLYPFPCLYGKKDRTEQARFGFTFSQKAEEVKVGAPLLGLGEEAVSLYERAHLETNGDNKDGIHPIRYAAAVLFEDGSMAAAHQLKALEYGGTISPVSQLAMAMEDKQADGVKPKLIVQVDQFGICHAPFAVGRSFLSEHGFGDVSVLVHDESGVLHAVRAKDLVPEVAHYLAEGDLGG